MNIVSFILLAAGGVFFVFAIRERKPYKKAEMENKVLQRAVILGQKEETEPLPIDRRIDFDALKRVNKDIVAWIYIPGTSIDYPVLIGRDDSEYLKKDFRGKESRTGAVFAFSDTSKDFSDAHICLFGHNMRAAQMFGELKKYKTEEAAKRYPSLYCYTPEGITEYRLFSTYECEKTDATFEHKMQMNSGEYLELLDRAKRKNMVKKAGKSDVRTEVDGRQLITLSCCSDYKRTVNRMTVHFLETKQIKSDLQNR